MFCFDKETAKVLKNLGDEIRCYGRNREVFSKVDYPSIEAMACLLINLSNINISFSDFPKECEVLLNEATNYLNILSKKAKTQNKE